MRLALLSSAASVHTWRWAAALAERGMEVRLFSLEATRSEEASSAGARGVSLVRLPSPPLPGALRYPLAAPALRRALAAFAPDVVDAHFVPNYGVLGVLSGRRPLSVSSWGSDLLAAHDPLRRARVRWVLGRADRVFVDAEVLASAARGLGVSDERLSIVPWGIEPARFLFSADGSMRSRARATWPEAWLGARASEGPVVASTRVLHPIYDVDILVRAWAAVSRAVPRAVCLVAGDGPRRPALERLAIASGVASSLRFLGRLGAQELARLLGGADVYVSTSRSDSTSLSLLEAMAAGAYPVVTDIAGNREWVGEERAGLFPAGDAEALARRLVEALRDPAERTSARTANRRLVEERGDRARAMDRVSRELARLAEGREETASA